MEHLAFDQIRQYYEQSRELDINITGPIEAIIPYKKYDRPYVFHLRYNISKSCW